MESLWKAIKRVGLAIALLGFASTPTYAAPNITPRLKPVFDVERLEEITVKATPDESVQILSAIPIPRLAPHLSQSRRAKPVIYIDPGHGGRDPGAIGIKGTHEKVITTKASQTLKALLEKTGRYEVVLTRPKDSYIEHATRLRLAREGGADLFISIHADSAGNKNARGASVYTLADRAKGRSKRLVNTSQNWIVDIDLSKQSDPVGDILVDLAQRKTESQSEAFADILLDELGKSTQLIGNSHRRAGYFVLLAPDVPAVLLELGFLSNVEDEKLLNKASHRDKIMKSVVSAIDKYFAESQ